jgi:hypothetical protein
MGPAAGWLVIGARDRAAKNSALGLWEVVVVTFAMVLPLILACVALYGFSDLSSRVTYSSNAP